jgi:hypothetical protein
MLIYLAGKPQNHEQFAQYAKYLGEMGPKFGQDLTVLSSWHNDGTVAEALSEWKRLVNHNRSEIAKSFESLVKTGEFSRVSDTQPTAVLEMQLTEMSQKCQHEFENADIVIADISGGAFEAGYGLAKGKLVITFGGDVDSPMFYDDPNVRSFATWTEAVGHLLGPTGRFRHQRRLQQEAARTADTD